MVSHNADEVLFGEAIAEKTGLHPRTVSDLLERGWTYRETSGQPTAFLDPTFTAKIRKLEKDETASLEN